MRRFVRFSVQLVASALAFVAITVAWIIFDGLNDVGDNADVALVYGYDENPGDTTSRLEHVMKLYKDGDFPKMIISAGNVDATYDEQASITKYFEDHGVPSSAILEDTGARNTADAARDIAALMKSHELGSIMLVTDYYRMSRLKLALLHAGVSDIRKSHLGTARVTDAVPIGREVYELYAYIGRTFLMPAAEKIKSEAETASDKAKVEAEKAKDTVNRNLDSLPK